MSREAFFQHTQQVLEWPRLLELLAAHAHSSLGADYCRSLPLAENCTAAESCIHETTEMIALSEGSVPCPVLTFYDTHNALLHAEKGAALDAITLRRIADMVSLLVRVQRCFTAQKEHVPHLCLYTKSLQDLSALESDIEQCISPAGEILDHASSVLYDAIQESQALKARIRQRLEAMMTSSSYRDALQEPYFAQRENRYVLPIKIDRQHQVAGIVHDVSSSGCTVFLEPRELIELNNRIKVAEREVDREVHRILTELTLMVAGQTQTLQHSLHILTLLDSIGAKARLSQQMRGYPVQLSKDGDIRLTKARHPLLALTRHEVIPNTIIFEHDHHILVISGPNTGGKTVNLKLLGLYSLMVRAGLHLPCAEGSTMGFFAETYADIGDAQDLTHDLSSFSAHLTKIIELVNIGSPQASRTSSPTLILLDEVISSTDPAEGAALAEAVLMHFAQQGFKVVVTTHYNSLKTLACSTPDFLNASLEFDITTLAPTYRLIQGIPGGSSALEIAGRLGMTPSILQHAAELMHHQDRQLEQIFAALHDMHHRLRQEVNAAEHHRRTAAQSEAEAQERVNRLRTTEREALRTINKKWKTEFARARLKIRQTLETLRQEPSLSKAQDVNQRVRDIEVTVTRQIQDDRQTIPLGSLHPGALVEISHLGTCGILLENPEGKKRVRLRVGESELSVAVERLIGRSPHTDTPMTTEVQTSSKRTHATGVDEHVITLPIPSGLLTIDLRGQTVEDALAYLASRLDQASLTSAKTIHVIHGHGTGTLQKATRHYLAHSPYVESYHTGEQRGAGVTIVDLH